jgi:hypothetical protein
MFVISGKWVLYCISALFLSQRCTTFSFMVTFSFEHHLHHDVVVNGLCRMLRNSNGSNSAKSPLMFGSRTMIDVHFRCNFITATFLLSRVRWSICSLTHVGEWVGESRRTQKLHNVNNFVHTSYTHSHGRRSLPLGALTITFVLILVVLDENPST